MVSFFKVHVGQEHAERGHENVVHEGLHHCAERAADDDAHGHIDQIAFEGEFLELLEHCA
jgi:hypothetical protein